MTTELAERITRESIATCAEDAHKRARHGYNSHIDTAGYTPAQRAEHSARQDFLSAACVVSDVRERNFYEEAYAARGGDPADLPWRKEELKAEKHQAALEARLAVAAEAKHA